MRLITVFLACLFAAEAQSTRELNEINWMEFRELVPARHDTVLLPVGTIEAHGVAPNGSDNIAPVALARKMAPDLNALVAPLVAYGITGSLDAFAGGITIPEPAFRAYMTGVMEGLARNGFRNIIVVNGHGGNTAVLSDVAMEVGRRERVRTLVTNWWSICSDVTLKVFGEDGGHAGWNETAFIQAIDPKLIRRERYNASLASPRAEAGTWSAYPFPSSIILYKAGQGYPKFDQDKADAYFRGVTEKMTALVRDTISKWNAAGIFEKK